VLRAETGAESWNIADFLTRWETGQLRHEDGRAVELGPGTVLLVDEAGTVDSRTQLALLEICRASQVGAVRLIGDPSQTQPVGAGGVFGFLARSIPASHLTVNYRQGDPEDTHEAVASRLLREGRGRAYLEAKDAAGLLHIAPTEDEAVVDAVAEWAANLAQGASPREHVLISDTNRVVDSLNPRARAAMRAQGRLHPVEVVAGGVPYSVGDRVAFLAKHVMFQPRRGSDGDILLRADGSPRQQRLTIPKRTRGEVIGVDPVAGTISVRTDTAGRLPTRDVLLTTQEAAGESLRSPVRLGHGYAMTVAIAQARGWSDSYLVLTASQLTGLEQTYTAQTRATRCTRLYGGADRILGGDMPEDWLRTRDHVKDTLAETLVRSTRKVTTLDYLDPGERTVLEERFAAPRQSPPRLDAPASAAQLAMAERLGRTLPADATWLEASAAVDLVRGQAPGTQAVAWLSQLGIPGEDAWRRVASALEDQEVRTPLPRQPIPSREGRAAAETDPHLAAIEELIATPPSERLDAAERYRRELPLVASARTRATRETGVPQQPNPAAASAASWPASPPQATAPTSPPPSDQAPAGRAGRTVADLTPEQRQRIRGPVVELSPEQRQRIRRPLPEDTPASQRDPEQARAVRAPRPGDDDDQRRLEELGREAAERAARERQRGPRQGQ
jgi:hypothetical protein